MQNSFHCEKGIETLKHKAEDSFSDMAGNSGSLTKRSSRRFRGTLGRALSFLVFYRICPVGPLHGSLVN